MITDGDAVWTMVQCPSVEDRGTEPLGMLADHDELIDAEARQPLTSRDPADVRSGSWLRENPSAGNFRARLIQPECCPRMKHSPKPHT